jgi:PKD repeat protein
VLLFGAVPALATAAAPSVPGTTPLDGYVTNGVVNSVVQSSAVTYLGGEFTEVGPRTGSFAGLSASTAAYESQLAPEVDGQIYAIAPDGSGGWYIGGSFSAVGAVAIQNAAHITSSGTLDIGWTPGPNAQVSAIGVSPDGSTVYLGGQFTSVSGSSRASVAAVSASTGLATVWNPDTTGEVNAIAVSSDGSTVYVGGSGLAGACGTYVDACALRSSTGTAVSGWAPGLNGEVNAIAVSSGVSGTVYLGGDFSSADAGADIREGAVAVGAAGTTNNGVISSWNPISSFGDINALILSPAGSTVYLGGIMSGLSGYSGTLYAAAVGITGTGDGTGWDPGPNGDVLSMGISASGSTVYLGGNFTTVNSGASTTVARSDAAAISSSTGYDTGWNAAPDAQVYAIGTSATSVMLGGLFDTVNEKARDNLAALTTSTGDVTPWNPGASAVSGTPFVETLALSADDSTLYAGGSFTTLGGAGQTNAGAVSTSTGVNTGWDPGFYSGDVSAIAVGSSYVYVAGGFTVENSDTANPVYVDGLDAFSPSGATDAGTAVPGWNSGVGGGVETMAVSGSVLFIGGAFTTAGSNVTREHVAAVDAATGALDSWNPDASNDVNTLAVSPNGSTVYLGGSFEEIGGTVRSFAGAVSASTGEVTSWNPSPNGGVSTIAPAPNGAVVYLGGAFSSISSSGGTVTRSDAAAVDTNNGYDLGWDPQVNGVYSIAASSTTVAVGGQGSDVGDIPQAYIALFAAAPTAAFSWQQSLTSLAVQFTDASSAVSPSTITAWTWNFGDGNTSNAENPDHTYAASGDYDVTLTVTDNNGEQDVSALEVDVTGIGAAPTASFTNSQNASSLAVQFTDTSTAVSPATITGWSWTFGDGGSSTAADPDHTYTATGDYQVSLTVTDSNGHHGTFQGSVVVSTPAGSGTGSSGSGTGGSGSGTGGSGSGTGGSGSGTGGSGPSTGGSGSGSGSSGSGSAGSSSSGSGGSDSGSGSGSPTPTPTTVQIQKILNGSLIPSGAHVSITTILSGGSFKTPFTPPEPGKLTVNWYAKHRSGRSGHRSNSKTKLILVASCAETFSSDKKSTVKIKLTSAGRNVLRSAKQVALTADDTFTPKGKKAIKTSKQFTLKAGRK